MDNANTPDHDNTRAWSMRPVSLEKLPVEREESPNHVQSCEFSHELHSARCAWIGIPVVSKKNTVIQKSIVCTL